MATTLQVMSEHQSNKAIPPADGDEFSSDPDVYSDDEDPQGKGDRKGSGGDNGGTGMSRLQVVNEDGASPHASPSLTATRAKPQHKQQVSRSTDMLLAQAAGQLQDVIGVGQGINGGDVPSWSNIASAPAGHAANTGMNSRAQNQADIQKLAELWLAAPNKKRGKKGAYNAATKTVEANDDFFMIKPSSIMQHKHTVKQKSGTKLLSAASLHEDSDHDHVAMASADVEDVIDHVNRTEASLPDYSAIMSDSNKGPDGHNVVLLDVENVDSEEEQGATHKEFVY